MIWAKSQYELYKVMSKKTSSEPFLKPEDRAARKPVDPRLWLILLAIPILYFIYDGARGVWLEWFPPEPPAQNAAIAEQGAQDAAQNCDFSNGANLDRRTAARRGCPPQ